MNRTFLQAISRGLSLVIVPDHAVIAIAGRVNLTGHSDCHALAIGVETGVALKEALRYAIAAQSSDDRKDMAIVAPLSSVMVGFRYPLDRVVWVGPVPHTIGPDWSRYLHAVSRCDGPGLNKAARIHFSLASALPDVDPVY